MFNRTKISGMDELLDKIEKIGKEDTEIKNHALKKCEEVIKALAKSEAPILKNLELSEMPKYGTLHL